MDRNLCFLDEAKTDAVYNGKGPRIYSNNGERCLCYDYLSRRTSLAFWTRSTQPCKHSLWENSSQADLTTLCIEVESSLQAYFSIILTRM